MKRKSVFILVGSFCLILMLAALPFKDAHSAPSPSEEPIKLGHIIPFTGDLSFVGEAWEMATILAVEHINAAGGVLGRDIEVIFEDSGTDARAAVDALEKLITIDGVQGLGGGTASFEAMASYPKLKLNKVVMISPSATSPALTGIDDDDFFFRLSPSDTLQAGAMAILAWDKGHRTANVISRNDDYGLGLEKVFINTFEELGGEIPVEVRYDPKAPDLSSYIIEISREPADVIVVNSLMEDGVRLFRKMHTRGITGEYDFIVCEGVQAPGIPVEVGPHIMEGVGGATPYPIGSGTFIEDFIERWGEEPFAYEANVYDAFILFALAIEKAGEYDGTAIRDNLRAVANPPGIEVSDVTEALRLVREGQDISYQGAGGEITFDEYGDVSLETARVWEYDAEGNIVFIKEIEVF